MRVLRGSLFRSLLITGLGLATLAPIFSTPDASAQGTVRDHRGGRQPVRPQNNQQPPQDMGPREAPPPPRTDNRGQNRRGSVWVEGSWDWRGGKWEWEPGRWENERKGKRWRSRKWEQRNGQWVRNDGDWEDYDDRPRVAPPVLRDENMAPRRGFTFVRGHWDWQNGNWEWTPGRWERERRGKRWREARWDNQNGVWIQVNGDWEDYDDRPRVAPPAPREESFGERRGFTFVRGHYEWRNGNWEWTPGRWERRRKGKRWRDARWENQNGVWVKVNGTWDEAPRYPNDAPPQYRDETSTMGAPRRGFIWIKGRWAWNDGNWEWQAGRWERERTSQQWTEGRWEQRNGQWMWIDGSWATVTVSQYPTAAPPAPQNENTGPSRNGYTWIRGKWDWTNGNWAWTPGHWERSRANKVWIDGRWEQRNGQWTWIEGQWGVAQQQPPPPTQPPPPPPTQPTPMPIGSPTQPPPPPPAENPGPTRAGYVWVPGDYQWRLGKYDWVPGHWERARARKVYEAPRWELRGNVYVRIEGGWR